MARVENYYLVLIGKPSQMHFGERKLNALRGLASLLEFLNELWPAAFSQWYLTGDTKEDALKTRVYPDKLAVLHDMAAQSEYPPMGIGLWTGELENESAGALTWLVSSDGRPDRIMLRFNGSCNLWQDLLDSHSSRLVMESVTICDANWAVLAPRDWRSKISGKRPVNVGWITYLDWLDVNKCEVPASAELIPFRNGGLIRVGATPFCHSDQERARQIEETIDALDAMQLLVPPPSVMAS